MSAFNNFNLSNKVHESFTGFNKDLASCFFRFLFFKLIFPHVGEDVMDTDIPTETEARLFKNTAGKTLWMFLQPFFYAFRPFIIYKKVKINGYVY